MHRITLTTTLVMTHTVHHQWLPYWLTLGGYDMQTGEPAKIKECFKKLGINNRTFKLYAEYGDGLLRPLGSRWLNPDRPGESLSNAVEYLRLLSGCEIDIAPPRDLVAALAQCIPVAESILAMPTTIFRGAWQALEQADYRGENHRAFVESTFVPAMKWFFLHRATLGMDSTRGKTSWEWLRKHWLELRRRLTLPPPGVEWEAPLRSAQTYNLRFIPLQSLAALQDESEVMQHCVAEFADCCRKGCLHVFSVRDARSLDRIATIALRCQSGSWAIADFRRQKNSLPTESATRAAWSFLTCVEESAEARDFSRETCDECL